MSNLKTVIEKAKNGLDIQIDPIEGEGAIVITGTAMSQEDFITFYDRLQTRLFDYIVSGSGTYDESNDTFEIGISPAERVEDKKELAASKAEQLPQDVSISGDV